MCSTLTKTVFFRFTPLSELIPLATFYFHLNFYCGVSLTIHLSLSLKSIFHSFFYGITIFLCPYMTKSMVINLLYISWASNRLFNTGWEWSIVNPNDEQVDMMCVCNNNSSNENLWLQQISIQQNTRRL